MRYEDEDGGVRVTGMRYTIFLNVNVYSHVDRFFKRRNNLLSMLSAVSFHQLQNRALPERARIAK